MRRRRGEDEDEDEIDPGPDQFPGEPPIPLDRTELALVRRAIDQGWDVPDVYFRRFLARAGSILKTDLASSRTVLRTGEVLAKMKTLRLTLDERDAEAKKTQEENARPRIIIPGCDARSAEEHPG